MVASTYRVAVKQPPEIGRQRFARFVSRVLGEARDRGMNDAEIHRATSISPSTFHRWQRGDFRTAPDVVKITSFCDGLGVPAALAMRALGAEEGRDDPAPEPAMDPDVRRILRALADPHVSDTDKIVIRETLKMLANRVTAGRRGELKDH
jgi:transcriptional regulator with XRE-family HTH domain